MARSVSRAAGGRGGNAALRLAGVRQFHSYLGAFIAPSVLFFAITGSLQLFNLHEAHGAYQPPALIEKLSAVHKDQRFAAKPGRAASAPRTAAAEEEHAGAGHDEDHATPTSKGAPNRALVLKWLFLAVAISLIASTCLGIWMAITNSRRKVVVWALLILGAALPVLILAV